MLGVPEVQLKEDEQKLLSWPGYVVNYRAKQRCDVILLVVTPFQRVADWAARPIPLGPGSVVRPLAVGPRGVPVVTDRAIAERDPELAVLSAMAHGNGDVRTAVDIALAAAHGARSVDDEHRVIYSDKIIAALGKAARKAFEMDLRNYQFQSEPLRKSYERGKVETRALDVIEVLTARGVAVDASHRARITACTDWDELSTWVRRAATVETADELFEGE